MASIKLIGQIHEDVAKIAIGGDAVNLNNNEKLKDIKLRGDNYPVYDIFSSTEICSVKVRTIESGEPNIQSYKREFLKMLGYRRAYDRGLSPIQQDAQRIVECGKSGIPIPETLKNAKPENVESYLLGHSTMRIPSDHVEAVRSALISDARQLPQNYFLPKNPTENQLKGLANRIQSTGMSYAESLKLANSRSNDNNHSDDKVLKNNAFTAQSNLNQKNVSREKSNAFTKVIKTKDHNIIHDEAITNPKDRFEEATNTKSTGNITHDNLKKSR